MKHLLPMAAYAAATLLLVPANAQELETLETAEPAPVKEDGPKLDEIIVTAQKRAEDIQDVPLSITAIGGETIKEKNMGDLGTVAQFTPNLDINVTPQIATIRMRGLGSDWNRGFEQSVAIVIDEVFYGRSAYLTNGMLDLANIEVLRGPQGTLFGKNAVAGALHMRSANPGQEWAVDADATYGTDNFQRYRAALGGPIVDDALSFRLAVLRETRDGRMFNTTLQRADEDLENQAARLKLLWDVTPGFSLLASLSGGNVAQDGNGVQPVKAAPRHVAAMEVFDPAYSTVTDDKTHKNHVDLIERDYWDATLTATWDIGEATLINIANTAWFDEDMFVDADFNPIPLVTLSSNENYRQYSNELRLTSGPGPLRYVAGLYYFSTNILATHDFPSYVTAPEGVAFTGAAELIGCDGAPDEATFRQCRAQTLNNEAAGQAAAVMIQTRIAAQGVSPIETSSRVFDQDAESYAAFTQFDWDVTEDIGFTLGARISYEKKSLSMVHILMNNQTGQQGHAYIDRRGQGGGLEPGSNPLGVMVFPALIAGIEEFEVTKSRHEFDISPKVSLQYHLYDDVMLFGTWARGFKSGGFNSQANNPHQFEFDEETSDTFEIGTKSEWLEGALRINATAFYTQFAGLQVASFNGFEFVVDNAADATTMGVEWDVMMATPIEGLLLSLNGAYTDATFDSYLTGTCKVDHYGPQPCDLSGQTLPRAPKWTHGLSATWITQLFDWPVNLFMTGDALYASEMFYNEDHDLNSLVNATWELRAAFGLHDIDGVWQLTLHADNLTDVQRLTSTVDTPAQDEGYANNIEKGRNFELQARVTF